MTYIFDTSSCRILRHYYPNRFPSVWAGLDQLVAAGEVISTREVFNELEQFDDPGPVLNWAKHHKEIFTTPTNEETEFVARIFQVQHFHALIAQKSILTGRPVADPFVVAAAAVRNGTVVTQEVMKPNAAKIPNVCAHFNLPCMNLEEFMTDQGWNF
ncbi:MAG: PIN domain-containing protein [Pyrinomonadaceae bacterium]